MIVRTPTRTTTKRARVAAKTRATRALTKTASVPRGVRRFTTGFPPQFFMKHKYVKQYFQIGLPQIGPIFQTFLCNGMFDPDVTSVGHQPYYFDQLAAVYDHWHVLSSTIRITVKNCYTGSGAGFEPFAHGVLYIDDDSTPSAASVSAAAELPSAGPYKIMAGTDEPTVFTRSWNAKRAYGGDIMDNALLRGSANADPTETESYVLCLGTPAATSSEIGIVVEIIYNAVWSELRPIAAS